MKMSLLLVCLSVTVFAQDFRMQTSSAPIKTAGYTYENTPIPAGIHLMDLDKNPLELPTKHKLSLIQFWSSCCGGEGEDWLLQREMENRFKVDGLVTYSINFENGTSFLEQHERVVNLLEGREMPANLYFDFYGYAYDLLKVTGFPTFMLVEDGKIVFRTNGKVEEGLMLLETEITERLKKR